eukprot:CAMPEP_0172518126 /NCGR_PEP_ID=MMETSP1066-20121228/290627_1 /TAXON_ID=671091 /ORGANISM="Coscinodiscus wailesii, Strain CCMP2513" /LENGTH=654 /DNA_ID=CAMNT_0013300453 /DNA_START=84 /DNA_END=2048 /DNA_ORIENTATION=+
MSELKPLYPPVAKAAIDHYKAVHARSVSDTSTYWSELAKSHLDWFAPFTTATHGSFEDGDVSFFVNGKLNACYNAVDRHVLNGKKDEVAVIWEGDEPKDVKKITFGELLQSVCRIANAFKEKGIKKGDVVTIYLPMIPETLMVMLACARIGAVHSVVFAGFSADAIAERISCARSKYVVTADGGLRGGKKLALKSICDNAISKDICGGIVETVFVFHHYSVDESTVTLVEGRDESMSELLKAQRPYCPAEWMDSEDPLFILYTSGSTGRPKGLLHTTGGYCLYSMYTCATSFDLKHGRDIFACVADAGWITGHSYIVYGPLLNGLSTFMFESTPLYPDAGRYWDMIQRHKITVFYTAPTAIRSLMRFGDDVPNKYDLSSLHVLGTVGEPINPEAWRWYHDVIGGADCSVVDTYWQTETGGHVITNLPGVTPMKPGSCTLPFFGIELAVLDPQSGKELEGNGVEGVLAIKQPWPGMARTCLGDHDRYLTTYMRPYPGYYFPGDGCRRDEDGYIWITGRVDDVINVSGHRIGTAEIESALVAHTAVSQAAVVGFPHEIKGQGICAYCTLTVGVEENADLLKQLKNAVRSSVGPFASPDIICCTAAMPMTRSGKIMRRILRKISSCESDSIGDTSTLSDPDVVDKLIEKMNFLMIKK